MDRSFHMHQLISQHKWSITLHDCAMFPAECLPQGRLHGNFRGTDANRSIGGKVEELLSFHPLRICRLM
jgi:hypothetical protein